MDREPSIHVTRSVFLSIVKDLGIKLSKPNLDRIMKAARELSADNRTMIAKANQTRQVRKTEGTIKEANLVAEIIYGIRVKLRHVGVTKIKQSEAMDKEKESEEDGFSPIVQSRFSPSMNIN